MKFIENSKFDKWNEVKKKTNDKKEIANFKEREIYWANIGENIGFEQNGKGDDFVRPILIFRKFSLNMFLGIPLSTQFKKGSFFFQFEFLNKSSTALLVQTRMYDVKRLHRKLGMINKNDFEKMEIQMKKLIRL